ncbi:hypothetical protein [Deinococcus psychrotolerans]|uniref:hypothetical protein n=1 Tax=Deinococcus psychrotolerans TaxID=2489213 RepID=UPI001F1555F0|nr:hypothetical protein [Deinococcus psychrotolerans]
MCDGTDVSVSAAVSAKGIDAFQQIQVEDGQNVREDQGTLRLHEGAAREAAGQRIEVGMSVTSGASGKWPDMHGQTALIRVDDQVDPSLVAITELE